MIGVDLEQINQVPIARSRGDIDAANADSVRAELAESVGSSAENLILDLSDTRYLDSAGIDMLLRLSERLRQRRAKLRLVIPPSSQVLRLAELVALPDAMPVHSTIEEALDACTQERA